MPSLATQLAQWVSIYGMADDVADSLKAPRPAMIAVTTEFNASYTRVGWRRRHVLRLGLPLLAVLDEQEAMALLDRYRTRLYY